MKILKTILIFIFLGFISSCNYKELGCVICQTRKKSSIEKYSNGQIKKITKRRIKSTGAIDVPFKEISRIVKYDSLGRVIERTKKVKVGSVWNVEFWDIKIKSKIDSLNGKYLIKDKYIMKHGEIMKDSRKIKKKTLQH